MTQVRRAVQVIDGGGNVTRCHTGVPLSLTVGKDVAVIPDEAILMFPVLANIFARPTNKELLTLG